MKLLFTLLLVVVLSGCACLGKNIFTWQPTEVESQRLFSRANAITGHQAWSLDRDIETKDRR